MSLWESNPRIYSHPCTIRGWEDESVGKDTSMAIRGSSTNGRISQWESNPRIHRICGHLLIIRGWDPKQWESNPRIHCINSHPCTIRGWEDESVGKDTSMAIRGSSTNGRISQWESNPRIHRIRGHLLIIRGWNPKSVGK